MQLVSQPQTVSPVMDYVKGGNVVIHYSTVKIIFISNHTVLDQARLAMDYTLTSPVELYSEHEGYLMQQSIGWRHLL